MTNERRVRPMIVTSDTVGDIQIRNVELVKYFVSQKLMKLWPSANSGNINFRLAQY